MADSEWSPDVRTLEWLLSDIDEAAVGRMIKEQLVHREPAISVADEALLGEAAVECAVIPMLDRARGGLRPSRYEPEETA